MMKGLMSSPGNPLMGPPMGSGIPTGGPTPASRQIQKFDNRLHQVEQSNRALLEELMRIQNEMKTSTKKEQQKLEEQRREQQKYEQAFRLLQSKVVEAEERAKRTEQVNTEMRQTIQQLQLAQARQGPNQPDNNQWRQEVKKEMDHFNSTRDYLEKITLSFKNDLTDLKGKVQSTDTKIAQIIGSLPSTQTGGRRNSEPFRTSSAETQLKALQQKFQELQSNLVNETKARESLELRVTKGQGANTNDERFTKLSDQLTTVTQELHQVLAVEIQTRRDQFDLVTSQIQACNDNVRAGVMAIQNKVSHGTDADINWKLDAVKVHQISQDAANDMKKSLDKELTLIKKEQADFKEFMQQNDQKTKRPLSNVDDKFQPPNVVAQTNPNILGDRLDQRLDQLAFGQEKLKKQVNDMQHELHRFPGDNEDLSLEDKLTTLDRKVTARMDGETKERVIEGKNLKNEIELIKKNGINTGGTIQKEQPKLSTDELKNLKDELEKGKVNFRKMAESIQVIKTTLGDQLNEETKIRKEETRRLEKDISVIKTWMKSNSKEI